MLHEIIDVGNGNLIIKDTKMALGYPLNGVVVYNNNSYPSVYKRAKALVAIPLGLLVYLDINNNASLEATGSVSVGISIVDVPMGATACFLVSGLAQVNGAGNKGDSVYVLGNELSSIVADYQLLGAVFIEDYIIKVEL